MKVNPATMSAMDRSNGIAAYNAVIKEISESTIPALNNFTRLLKEDPEAAKRASEMNRIFTGNTRKFWTEAVVEVLNAHVAKEGAVEDMISEVVPKTIVVEQLDSRSAQVAQYIDNLTFFSQTSRRMVIAEIDTLAKHTKRKITPILSPAEIKETVKSFDQYRLVFKQLKATASIDMSKAVLDMPEFAVGKVDEDVIVATYGRGGATPIAQGFFSAGWNPIFAIRQILNQRLIKRYHVAKEERQALEYRVQALIDSRTDREDPRLEQIIEYHTGQLKRLNLELSSIEEKAR